MICRQKGCVLMRNRRMFRTLGLVLALGILLAACVPGQGPRLRSLHGQVWGSNFQVQVQLIGGTSFNLPVRLELDFDQRFTDITAEASLAYDLSIFRLNFGDTELTGRLGLDDSLTLSNRNDLLQFDGRFVGEQLHGVVSVGGFVSVGEMTFSRVR